MRNKELRNDDDRKLCKALAAVIDKEIRRQGLTCSHVAKMSGILRQQLQYLTYGIGLVNLGTLNRVCLTLKISLGEVFRSVDEEIADITRREKIQAYMENKNNG